MIEYITVWKENSITSFPYKISSREKWRKQFLELKKERYRDRNELEKIYTALLFHDTMSLQNAYYLEEHEYKIFTHESPIQCWYLLMPSDYYGYEKEILELPLEREKTTKDLETEIFYTIKNKFSRIEKVDSIHIQRYRKELIIQIPISISQYDKKLMIKLFGIEYDIRKEYPGIVFNFSYPPIGVVNKEDFLHPEAICIYEK